MGLGLGLAALGGLAKGAQQGIEYANYVNEQKRRDDLLEKQDARNAEAHSAQMDYWNDAKQDRQDAQAIKQAYADHFNSGKINNNAAAVNYTDQNGQQHTAAQPDMATAQFAAQQQANEAGYPTDSPSPPQSATINNPTANQVDDQTNQGNNSDSSQPATTDASSAQPPADASAAASPADNSSPAPQVDNSAAQPQTNPSWNDGNPTVAPAISVRGIDGNQKLFTGLNAASDAKEFSDQNNPFSYAGYMALRDKLGSMRGGMKDADETLARAKQADDEGAYRAYALAKMGNFKGAEKVWNTTGNERLGAGEYLGPGKDDNGNPTGKIQVFNQDGSVKIPDVEQALVEHLAGMTGIKDAYKSKLAMQAKIAEERAKPFNTRPGDITSVWNSNTQKYETVITNGAPKGYEYKQDPLTGILHMVKIGDDSGPSAAETTQAQFDKTFQNKANDDWSQTQLTEARNLSGQIATISGVPPGVAIDVATKVVKNPALLQYAINESTGQMDRVYKDANYSKAIPVYTNVSTTSMKPEDQLAATKAFLSAMPKSQQADYVRSAFDPADYQQSVNAINQAAMNAAVAVQKANPNITTEQAESAARRKADADIAALNSKLGQIKAAKINPKDYGVNIQPPQPGQTTTPPLTVAQRLQAPGGFGSAIPNSAIQGALKTEANAQREKDADKAAAASKIVSDNKLKSEIEGLSPSIIDNMGIDEAQAMLNKYGNVVTPENRKALITRISNGFMSNIYP
jgi:hypothetical protein